MNKKRIKFGDLKIQKLNRVALPSSLLENLDLRISDEVELFLDVEKEEIIIKKLK
jgi:bifunctional DNA-binding transcriptional regulator/antitoxin component of YhaV-PrlF toxin-antitoxin module